MIGNIAPQGIISGCKMEEGELVYLISRADGRPGEWIPAREAIHQRAQNDKQIPIHSLTFDSPVYSKA